MALIVPAEWVMRVLPLDSSQKDQLKNLKYFQIACVTKVHAN